MKVNKKFSKDEFGDRFTPAYTLDELMDWLPAHVNITSPSGGLTYFLRFNKVADYYSGRYEYNNGQFKTEGFANYFAAECVGKLLMWCIKEGYL